MRPAFVVIDGKRHAWKDILKLRRELRGASTYLRWWAIFWIR
jgi:hypothetical protein